MNKKIFFPLIIILILFILATAINAVSINQGAEQGENQAINVYTIGGTGSPTMKARALIDNSRLVVVNDIVNADIVLIFDAIPSTAELNHLVTKQTSVVLFMGPVITDNNTLPLILGFTAFAQLEINSRSAIFIKTNASQQDKSIKNIAWNTIPEVDNFTLVKDLTSSAVVLLESENGDPLIVQNGSSFIFTPWTGTGSGESYNFELVQSPYFNYVLFVIESMAAGQEVIPSYASWEWSPVPHSTEQLLIGLAVLMVVLVSVTGFYYSRKYSIRSPVVIDKSQKEVLENELEEGTVSEWKEVGFHRQLGGFLLQLFIGLIVIIPNALFTTMIFPAFIFPSPQGVGFYQFTLNFFEALWLVFDFGTSVALMKYFAQYRVEEPEKAFRYVQIFVWWQILTGVVQLFLISFLGSIIFPQTYLAHLTWVFVTHSFVQYPAFFLVFIFFFQGLNRVDLAQVGNILYYAVLNIIFPYTSILIFRSVLGQNPLFGEALAGAIGYSIGQYLTEWSTFVIMILFYRKMGFSLKLLFRVDFGREEIKEALVFGGKFALGNMWVPLVWLLQVLLLSMWLENYAEQYGFFSLAFNFVRIVQIVGLFMQGLLAAFSESYSHGKENLNKLYVTQGLKYGSFFTIFLVAALWATGGEFILGGAGAEWAPAIELLYPLLIFQLLGFWSWQGDWMFAGANRTGLAAFAWIVEQGLRAILLVLLIREMGILAIPYAYIFPLAVKDLLVWILIRWKISNPKFYFWQKYAGPAIAGIVYLVGLKIIVNLVWQGDIVTSVLLFFLGSLVGLYPYAFLTGLTGSWDKNTLEELKKGAGLCTGLTWLSMPLYHAVRYGAKISPLHDRFPIDVFDDGIKEAKEITLEKVKLQV
ncbi:MAG: lipopolysaccharide biosynthesis protein [Candidatus Odinarchaeota archaeon]